MPGEQVTLWCSIWPDSRPDEHIFNVVIDNDKTVSHLKKCIKDEHPSMLASVDTSSLVLWTCSGFADDNGLEKSLGTVRFDGSDSRIVRLQKARQTISQIFEQVDLSKEPIHILVLIPHPDFHEDPPLLLDYSRLDLAAERRKFRDEIPFPSYQETHSIFMELQRKPGGGIFWSRPPGVDATIPVTLLHPIFREFIDNCKNHRPIEEDNSLVLELMAAMTGFFPNEGPPRAAEFCAILTRYGIPADAVKYTSSFHPDGAIKVDGHLAAVLGFDNEIGNGGPDPYENTILYYTYFNMEEVGESRHFNFPCFMINAFGPHISFSGAVWSSRPHLQVLTPTLPLFCHSTDTDMREFLARHFGAFRAAIRSLEKYYNALKDPKLLEDLKPEFPDPRSYKSRETNAIMHFNYLQQIDAKKLLFIGENSYDKERICIKFVRQYSPEAHEKCAQMGIAPELRGFEEIGGGWKMVIMDALDLEYTNFDKTLLPADAHSRISERLVELHRANFVHGDVRDVNIMVRKDGNTEEPWFMLVDFDCSGIIGQVYYPINVNNVGVWRPDGVSDGMLIKPDHDMAMLEHLFKSE